MKMKFSLTVWCLLPVVVALLLFPAPSVCAPAITNPGFETGSASPWTLTGCSVKTASWGIPVPVGTRYCGAESNWGTINGGGYQVVSGFTAGWYYRLTALCTNWDQRSADSPLTWRDNCTFRIGLNTTGAAGYGTGTSSTYSHNARWARYENRRIAASGTTMTVWFQFQEASATMWSFAYFDDFQVLEYPSSNSSAGWLQRVDFEDAYPGPFYGTLNAQQGAVDTRCLPQMLNLAGGANGTAQGLRMQNTGQDQQAARAIGTFCMEGPASTLGEVSCWMKCTGAAADVASTNHWMEFGWKTAANSAQDFDSNAATWTIIQKFDGYSGNSFHEGNNATWTKYTSLPSSVQTNASMRGTVGVKLGNGGGGTAGFLSGQYWFDEIQLEGALPVMDYMLY